MLGGLVVLKRRATCVRRLCVRVVLKGVRATVVHASRVKAACVRVVLKGVRASRVKAACGRVVLKGRACVSC